MGTIIKYKNYIAEVELDDTILHGRILNLRNVITFETTDATKVQEEFKNAVNDYIEWCKEDGVEPEKPYSGNLFFRTTPKTHKEIQNYATAHGKTMNNVLEEAWNAFLSKKLG